MVKSIFDDTGFDGTFLRVTYLCLDFGSFLNYSFHLNDEKAAQIHKTVPISSAGQSNLDHQSMSCFCEVPSCISYVYPEFSMI